VYAVAFQNRFAFAFRQKWILWGAVVLLAGIGLIALVRSNALRSTGYLIWKPLLDSTERITLCVSDNDSLVSTNDKDNTQADIIATVIASREAPPGAIRPNPAPTTPLVDADVASKIAGWLATNTKLAALRPSSALTLRDFRQGPVVLIGAFSNPWSLILLSNLRYSVRIDPATHEKWIQDSQNPSKREWKVDSSEKRTENDYGLITRYLDAETGQWILALGGLRPHGTEAAGDLLTDSSFQRSLPDALRSAKNFQMVVKTTAINGNAGPPQIIAVYTW